MPRWFVPCVVLGGTALLLGPGLEAQAVLELTGRVVNERGQPMPGVTVQPLAQAVDGDAAAQQSVSTARTDDTGTYRVVPRAGRRFMMCLRADYSTYPIPGLTAGQLQAASAPTSSATANRAMPPMLIDADGRFLLDLVRAPSPPITSATGHTSAYVTTCDPSPSSTPVVVNLEEGIRARVPDLVWRPQPTQRVSGRLVGPNGPLAATWLRLARSRDLRALGPVATALTSADGSYTFHLAPRGTFAMDIDVPNPPPRVTPSATGFPSIYHPDYGMTDTNGYWTTDDVRVADRDIDALVVRARPGVTVRGVVVFDDVLPSSVDLNRMAVTLEADAAGTSLGSTVSSRSLASGPFSVTGVKPGHYVVGARLQGGVSIVSITQSGVNVIDMPVQVDEIGVDDLEIHLTSKTTEVSGVVRRANGTIAAEAAVVAFPADVDRRTPFDATPLTVRRLRTSAGRYSLSKLPAGDYLIAAVEEVAMGAWPARGFMAALAPSATAVLLQSGDQRVLDLTVVTVK